MTQIESIQQNIHDTKVALNKSRRVICKDELQKIQVQANIDYYLNELKELNFCLKCAIKQASK